MNLCACFNCIYDKEKGLYRHSISIITTYEVTIYPHNDHLQISSHREGNTFKTSIEFNHHTLIQQVYIDNRPLNAKLTDFELKKQPLTLMIKGIIFNITKTHKEEEQDIISKLEKMNIVSILNELNDTIKSQFSAQNSSIQDLSLEEYNLLKLKFDEVNNMFSNFVELYHAKNKDSQKDVINISIVSDLKSLSHYLGDFGQPVKSLSEKIQPKKDLISEALKKAREMDMIGSLKNMIEELNTTQESSISIEEVQKIFSTIICDIWKQKENEKPEVRDLVNKICKEIDLEISIPSINSSYDFRESKIVKTTPKNATQANKAITQIITPCIKIKSTAKVLEKANVEVAE